MVVHFVPTKVEELFKLHTLSKEVWCFLVFLRGVFFSGFFLFSPKGEPGERLNEGSKLMSVLFLR